MKYTDSKLGQLIDRYGSTRDQYWLARHYVASSTLVTLLIASLAPESLNARAFAAAGPPAGWFVAALTLVSLASLYEALVTDFVPRLQCGWLRRRRHTLFMGVAVGQLCLAYALLSYAPNNWPLILRFSLDASAATALAFLDLFARHRADRNLQ
jgi:hypothetical protein